MCIYQATNKKQRAKFNLWRHICVLATNQTNRHTYCICTHIDYSLYCVQLQSCGSADFSFFHDSSLVLTLLKGDDLLENEPLNP